MPKEQSVLYHIKHLSWHKLLRSRALFIRYIYQAVNGTLHASMKWLWLMKAYPTRNSFPFKVSQDSFI